MLQGLSVNVTSEAASEVDINVHLAVDKMTWEPSSQACYMEYELFCV